jgi:hypothetical protein
MHESDEDLEGLEDIVRIDAVLFEPGNGDGAESMYTVTMEFKCSHTRAEAMTSLIDKYRNATVGMYRVWDESLCFWYAIHPDFAAKGARGNLLRIIQKVECNQPGMLRKYPEIN